MGNTSSNSTINRSIQIVSFCRSRSSIVSSLSQSQQDFLDHLPIAIVACDLDGNITQYNRRAVQLWGQEPKAGDRFTGAIRAYDSSGKLLLPEGSPICKTLRNGRPQQNVETVIERADGSRISVLSNIAPLFESDGTLLGAMETFHDITERRWSEDARRLADRMAASSRIAAEVARQLKNPLHAVSNLVDTLRQDSNLSAEARSCTELIKQELSRFDRLAREMVHVSMAV